MAQISGSQRIALPGAPEWEAVVEGFLKGPYRASEVTVTEFTLDDTGSIRNAGLAGNMIYAYNVGLLEGFRDRLARSGRGRENRVFVMTDLLATQQVIEPFASLPEAARLDDSNYRPNASHTPLNASTVRGTLKLDSVAGAIEEKFGLMARRAHVIVTDGLQSTHGEDAQVTEEDVAITFRSMPSDRFFPFALGLGNPSEFLPVFHKMGFRWAFAANTPAEIKEVVEVMADCLEVVSQGGTPSDIDDIVGGEEEDGFGRDFETQ